MNVKSEKREPSTATIRVLLVDDHRMMRDGLRSILELSGEMQVVGEAGDGRSALELVAERNPDVIVMDIGMPELNGIEATRTIRQKDRKVGIVALSTHSDRSYVLHMLSAGASAYVLKESAFEELSRAVLAVHRGGRYLSPGVTGLVVDEASRMLSEATPSAYTELGAKEREVLQLLAEGYTSPQIAKHTNTAVKTVETHRRNIMRKLDLHSVAALTKYAVREGLTTLEDPHPRPPLS